MSTLRIVPKPNLSLKGIQNRRTITLINAIAQPMDIPVCKAKPCESTVQGALPNLAETSKPSPMPIIAIEIEIISKLAGSICH